MAKAMWSGALAVFGIVLNGVALGFPGSLRFEVVPAVLGEAALLLAMWLWYSGAPQRRPPAEARPPISPRRALDQEQYAALIRGYKVVDDKHFERLTSASGGVFEARGLYCRRCRRPAMYLNTTHPIWDGPFDDGGSGKVDVLHFLWCAKCDGPPPDPAGEPIRLPYLDHLPIRLLPELYARPAFHQLVMPVEQYVPNAHPSSAEVADCPGCKTIGEPHRSPSREHPHGLAGLMEDT